MSYVLSKTEASVISPLKRHYLERVLMSKNEKKSYLPSQKFLGKQVIDLKGALIGNVKDLAVSVGDLDLALVVTTKGGSDIQVPWSEIQSIEDVVLLNKTVELPSAPAAPTVTPTPLPAAPSATVDCPSCKAAVPSHAKFCPRCGSRIR